MRKGYIDPFEPEEVRRLGRHLGFAAADRGLRAGARAVQAPGQGAADVDLHYALKPLPHPAVVRTVARLGGLLDLATTGEVQLITRLGLDPARCIHTHPIKRDKSNNATEN